MLFYNLFQTKEVRISTTEPNETSGALVCESKNPKDPFFTTDNAKEVEHEIKVTYYNDKANTFFYTYDAEFGSYNDADDAEAKIHADYNIYMASNVNDFEDNFAAIEDETKAEIYAEAGNLGSKTARIFFMSQEEFDQFESGYQIDQLKKLYESKDFQCEVDD